MVFATLFTESPEELGTLTTITERLSAPKEQAGGALSLHQQPPPFFFLFEIGLHIIPRPVWTSIILFVLSWVAGMKGAYHCTNH
jgi:hypothetical protein